MDIMYVLQFPKSNSMLRETKVKVVERHVVSILAIIANQFKMFLKKIPKS